MSIDHLRGKKSASPEAAEYVCSLQRIMKRFNGPPESWWTEDELREVAKLEGFEDVTSLIGLPMPELGPDEIREARTQLAQGARKALRYREAIARGKAFPEDVLGPPEGHPLSLDEAKETLRICVRDGIIPEGEARVMDLADLAGRLGSKIPDGPLECGDLAFTRIEISLPDTNDLSRHAKSVCNAGSALGPRWGLLKRTLLEELRAKSVEDLRGKLSIPHWLPGPMVERIASYALTGDPKNLNRQVDGIDKPIPLWLPCAKGGDQKLEGVDPERSQEFFSWTVLDLQEMAAKKNRAAKNFLDVISDPAEFDEKREAFLADWRDCCKKLGCVVPGKLLNHAGELLGAESDYETLRDFMFFKKKTSTDLYEDSGFHHRYQCGDGRNVRYGDHALRKAFRERGGKPSDESVKS